MTFQGNTEAPDQRAVTQASENAVFSREDYRQQVIRSDARIARLIAAMEAVCDELAEDFDCDYGDGSQPNKAMRLANELKEAIYGPGGY